jgi:hypothetical protein
MSEPVEDWELSEDSVVAFEHIAIALRQIALDVQEALDKIEGIAAEQLNRLDEDTAEHEAWNAFAGLGMISDVGRNRLPIMDHFLAIRGSLIYRGLDPNAKTLTPDEAGQK